MEGYGRVCWNGFQGMGSDQPHVGRILASACAQERGRRRATQHACDLALPQVAALEAPDRAWQYKYDGQVVDSTAPKQYIRGRWMSGGLWWAMWCGWMPHGGCPHENPCCPTPKSPHLHP